MDVSLKRLISSSQIETASFKTLPGGTTVPTDSYLFSNLACSTLLDMIANGAKGQQRKDLVSSFLGKPFYRVDEIFPHTLEFLTLTGFAGGPTISLSRTVWIHQSVSLNTAFEAAINKFYTPEIRYFGTSTTESENSEALKSEVNKWSQEKTGGLIEDSLGSTDIGADTRLIFTAALEFNGERVDRFTDAGEQQFTTINKQVVNMQYMAATGNLHVKQFKNYKMLSLPYIQNEASRFSMLFYLPDHAMEFEELMLFIGEAESVLMKVDYPRERVPANVVIPKFSLAVGGPLELVDGTPPQPYAFPNMANTPTGLTLATQKGMLSSALEINETSTRAAGVCVIPVHEMPTEQEPENVAPLRVEPVAMEEETEFVAPPTIEPSATEEVIDFVANRPFIFFVHDDKFRRMLFSGAVIDPVGQSASFKRG